MRTAEPRQYMMPAVMRAGPWHARTLILSVVALLEQCEQILHELRDVVDLAILARAVAARTARGIAAVEQVRDIAQQIADVRAVRTIVVGIGQSVCRSADEVITARCRYGIHGVLFSR